MALLEGRQSNKVQLLRYPYWSLASLSTVIQADIFAIIQLIKDASRATSAASVRMAASLSACSPSRNGTLLRTTIQSAGLARYFTKVCIRVQNLRRHRK